MTTDNPAKVARAYAEQACYQDENIPIAEAGFRAGWKAARTHLTEQEPTDAEAQAYLAAFVEDLPPGVGVYWTPDTIARVKRGLCAARRDKEKR